MHWLLYLRLILLTAGTLLPFFWMVVILGHRRQRNFERIFFFLCLALTCFFGSSLLELNAELYYGTPSEGLQRFCWVIVCLGLWFLPPLILHLHVEYADLRERPRSNRSRLAKVLAIYAPALIFAPQVVGALRFTRGRDFEHPSPILGPFYQAYLLTALALAVYWQHRFAAIAPDREQKRFHRALRLDFLLLVTWLAALFLLPRRVPDGVTTVFSLIAFLYVQEPLWKLLRGVQRSNFLQIGRQRNLIYAVFGVFLALLYLSFVRRASLWLEPYLPPEASAALLLFLPVVFFEPLQRVVRRSLQETAQAEVDRAQKLMGPISETARLGDSGKLKDFSEKWIAEQLQLAEVRIDLAAHTSENGKAGGSTERLEIRRGKQRLGWLRVKSFGAMISGETYAALELIGEQLPAVFDLCRLIEEKLQLERELAERERLALVGQMAASISHNLKNPLGSIKTILQVQLESPELPANLHRETQMVLAEINRLSARLNQLLQYSRPGARASGAQSCDLALVAETVTSVLRHAAEERRISLELAHGNGKMSAAIGEEAANDILSNVVLNAIEAASEGGHVRVSLEIGDNTRMVSVADDGPGISAADQEKVLQPFFTTKARGTGLGLAIVDRRLQEAGGKLDIESPLSGGHGTRIRLHFPLTAKEQAG
jgi:signal transduction histidine kinase